MFSKTLREPVIRCSASGQVLLSGCQSIDEESGIAQSCEWAVRPLYADRDVIAGTSFAVLTKFRVHFIGLTRYWPVARERHELVSNLGKDQWLARAYSACFDLETLLQVLPNGRPLREFHPLLYFSVRG